MKIKNLVAMAREYPRLQQALEESKVKLETSRLECRHLLANLDGDRAWRYDKDCYEANKKKKKNREMER